MKQGIDLLRNQGFLTFINPAIREIPMIYDHYPPDQRDEHRMQKVVTIDAGDSVVTFDITVRPKTDN